jgi:hypothetical protein
MISQGRTNNFTHSAIAELCKSLYEPGKLASLFPKIFEKEVPVKLVALAATVVCKLITMTGSIT